MSYFRIATASAFILASNIIEQINESPGIYFDTEGFVKITDDYLHVLIPIDIGYIKPHIDNIKSVLGTARFFCQQIEYNNSKCHNYLQPLAARLDSILRDYSAISHLISDRDKRSAWFAGIGSVFKQIIGTMDENDAIRYNNAIQSLDDNNKKLASLVKDNILMTNFAISNYNETLKTININEARLNSAIESLNFDVSVLSNTSSILYVESKMNEIYNELSSSLFTLSFRIENIVNSIMFTKSHAIHPSVLTPKQLYEELSRNVRTFIKHSDLPLGLNLNNIHSLIDLSKLLCYYIDNKIVFVMKIPLVNKIEYILCKTIPVPIPHDKQHPSSYAMVIPNSNYVAISRDKTTYVYINNLKDCIKTVNQIYICNNLNKYSVQNSPACETEILCKVLDKLPHQCKTKLIHGKIDIWQELTSNRWLFVETEPIKLTVECQQQISEFKLLGTGIMNLPPNCRAICNNKEFITKNNVNITVKSTTSDFNLINDPCCDETKFKVLKQKLKPMTLVDVNLEKLANIANDQLITDIDKIINEPSPLLKYESHYPILTYCIITLILIFVSFKLYQKFSNCYKLNVETTITNAETSNNPNQELDEIPIPRIRISS